jgi:putative membrane protein
MISEHGELASALAEAASAAGTRVPAAAADPLEMIAAERLGRASGVEFDRTYLQQQVGAHLDTVLAYTAEAHDGRLPALKQFASAMLPRLHDHLQIAIDDAAHARAIPVPGL